MKDRFIMYFWLAYFTLGPCFLRLIFFEHLVHQAICPRVVGPFLNNFFFFRNLHPQDWCQLHVSLRLCFRYEACPSDLVHNTLPLRSTFYELLLKVRIIRVLARRCLILQASRPESCLNFVLSLVDCIFSLWLWCLVSLPITVYGSRARFWKSVLVSLKEGVTDTGTVASTRVTWTSENPGPGPGLSLTQNRHY